MVRHGSLTTLDEQILDSTTEDENALQIRSENEAKTAAKKIFQNVARPGFRFVGYPFISYFYKLILLHCSSFACFTVCLTL